MPEQWPQIPLIDLVQHKSGESKIIKGKQSKVPQSNLVQGYSASGPDIWVSVAKYQQPGVVISAVGARCGKTFLAQGQWTPIANTHALIPSDEIDVRWLWYLTNNENFWIKGGSAQPFVKVKATLMRPVAIPPLEDQQRIVRILDVLFANIENSIKQVKSKVNGIRTLFQNSLDGAFVNDGWNRAVLEEILLVQPRNGWSPPAAYHSDAGTPVLTLSAVTGNVFRADQYKFTSAPVDSGRHYWVKNGDFLITRSNTPKLVGHVAIASDITTPTIYCDLIMRMNPDNEKVLTEFLYYQMRTTLLREEITSRAKGANPTMVKINKGSVQTIPISFPPLGQQQIIIDNIEQLSQLTQMLESIYHQELSALTELKQSILQEAFNGNL